MSDLLWAEFKEQVRSRTDLVELVSETVALQARQGGRMFVGLCPFHDDSNPSFNVTPDRQSYRCWSCSEGGDCFSFLMKRDGLDFREALLQLAQRANLEPPQITRRKSDGPFVSAQAKAELTDILSWVEDQCHWYLLNSPEAEKARVYLDERGITDESIQTFRLGYHGPQWQWLLDRAKAKFLPQQMVAAAVASEKNGRYHDHILFIDRIVFPIHDTQGRTVAFGGRVMPGSDTPNDAKYVNSNESAVFKKSRLLYGFDVSKKDIADSNTVVVCEGYTDCIAAHQHGLKNFVATLGTAFTEEHVKLTKRMANKVVLTYDGDQAGQDAALRVLEKLLSVETDLRILTLPSGLDPAEYLDAHGAEAFKAAIEDAPEAWDFKLKRTIQTFGTNSVDGRQRILDEMASTLASAPHLAGSIRESMIIQRLAARLSVDESTVREQIKQNVRQGQRLAQQRSFRVDTPEPVPVLTKTTGWGMEEELLALILLAPNQCESVSQQVGAADFQNAQLGQFFQLCMDIVDDEHEPSFGRVISETEDPSIKALAVRLDQESSLRGVAKKLADGTMSIDTVVQQIVKRREEESNKLLKARMSEESESNLSASARDMLQLMQERLQGRKTFKPWN